MGAPDANGIFKYTETDLVGTFSTLLNKGQDSVSTALAAVKSATTARLAALETPPPFLTYVPAITGPTTVSYGSGAARSGRYTRVGNLVYVTGNIQFGAGMNITSGFDWFLTLPIAAKGATVLGQVWMANGGSNWLGLAQTISAGVNFVVRPHAAAYGITSTNPWTWGAGFSIYFTLVYEANV